MKVLIMGAGLSGLTLAIALKSKSDKDEILIFERDKKENDRTQGLIIGVGQEVVDFLMNELKLGEECKDLFQEDGAKDIALLNYNNRILFKGEKLMAIKHEGRKKSCLVNRAALRNILLKKAEGISQVFYDKRFEKYEEVQNKVVVYFSDGSKVEGDVLIGADGAKSKVRDQRCAELIPKSLNVWNNYGYIDLSEDVSEEDRRNNFETNEIFQLSKKGLTRILGKNCTSFMTFCYKTDKDNLRFCWTISSKTKNVDLNNFNSQNFCKEHISSLAAQLISFTKQDKTNPGYEMYSIDPETLKSNPMLNNQSSLVTLIGDSFHKTTTQAGMGTIGAMNDAIVLAKYLSNRSNDNEVYNLLRMYEKEVLKKNHMIVRTSTGNTWWIHEYSNSLLLRIGLNSLFFFVSGILKLRSFFV